MADDGFEKLTTRKNKKKQRICLINLTPNLNLEDELVKLFEQVGISISPNDIEHYGKGDKQSHVVSCEDASRAIVELNGKEHNGKILGVKREIKGRSDKKGTCNFGAKAWTKPVTSQKSVTPVRPVRPNLELAETTVKKHIMNIEESEIKPPNSAVAMSLLASMNAFGADLLLSNQIIEQSTAEDEPNEPSLEDFQAKCKIPLSQLLSDYGQQDLDFKNKKIEQQLEDQVDESEPDDESNEVILFQSRLGLHKKAPIHVELTSFGFSHRAPTLKNWSHAQPLPPVDCRHLHETPYWLVRPDGRNPSVKRAILNEETRQLCRSFANQIIDAIQEATEAGYGHAMPLRINIYMGSEAGRHRSVVVCEATGIQLRKLLRNNQEGRISVPVSVGTLHQDIDRKQKEVKQRVDKEVDEVI